ncbi:leucine zipper domain-containing protein [Georgenia muralis]|uniref:leucine zipper domain-containing protein n=1 Tax=Georgenia muralis TaxID=154117 RepID=UPI000F50CF8D|nr:leucine zipper domain-containing protein [Georgenia muralis]
MSHRNARLNVRGRQLLVERACDLGWPVAHAAKAQGISRQYAHRWVTRFRQEGETGLLDRSSRPPIAVPRYPGRGRRSDRGQAPAGTRGPGLARSRARRAARTVSERARRRRLPPATPTPHTTVRPCQYSRTYSGAADSPCRSPRGPPPVGQAVSGHTERRALQRVVNLYYAHQRTIGGAHEQAGAVLWKRCWDPAHLKRWGQ